MTRLITSTKIEMVIKNVQQAKVMTRKLHMQIISNIKSLYLLFWNSEKISEKKTLPNSFYEATITRIPKPDKDITKKKSYRQISLMKIWSTNNSSWHISREKHTSVRYMHLSVHCSTIYNSRTWKQPKYHQQRNG